MEQENSKEKNSIAILYQRLEDAGIDTTLYGTGVAKTIENLYKEIESGESILITKDDGKLLRKLMIVGADIYYTSPEEKRYRLKEDRQVFNDGRIRRRDYGHAVSEKMKPGEDPKASVIRGIQEELGISGLIYPTDVYKDEKFSFSQTYPGLECKYIRYEFSVELNDEQFNPDGYIEEQDDKTTYFVWEEAG